MMIGSAVTRAANRAITSIAGARKTRVEAWWNVAEVQIAEGNAGITWTVLWQDLMLKVISSRHSNCKLF